MKTIQEILAKVKVNEDGSLDQSIVQELQQLVNEIVDTKVDMVAAQKVQEALNPTIEDAKRQLADDYANKFEDYKLDTATKFSNFCDEVFDAELSIPEDIKEWAYKGQRYADLIEQIRARVIVDEGGVNAEVASTLQEARDEITKLRNELNMQISENVSMKDKYEEVLLESKAKIEELASHVYISEKCEGLTTANRSKIMNLLKGETDTAKIDERYEFIIKNVINEDPGTPLGNEQTPFQQEVEQKCMCPSCGKIVTITDGNGTSCEMIKCPDCADVNLVCADCDTNEGKKKNKVAHDELMNEKFIINAAKLYAQYID